MKKVKRSLFLLSLLLLNHSPLAANATENVYSENFQTIAHLEALTLSNHGVLKQKENGFVYLDVSNKFITEILPHFDTQGELRARPTAARSLGAHISVFHEKEEVDPEEVGELFSFEIKGIKSFVIHTRDGLKKLWAIGVDSPELESLREKYECSSKLKGRDFHITLAKQMPTAPENWKEVQTLSHFNFTEKPTCGLYTEGDFVIVETEDLPQPSGVGQLRLKGNGFVYLDVDNQYIEQALSLIPLQGKFKPTSTQPKKMGAHISVIHQDEMISNDIWILQEAGEYFTFEVKELRYVDRGGRRLWLLAIDSPSLEELCTSYGLKPKLKNHDFHITIGYETIPMEEEFPEAA